MEKSKTIREIFYEIYPKSEVTENPMIAIEAIGWLKCAKQYNPSISQWIDLTCDFLLMSTVIDYFGKES